MLLRRVMGLGSLLSLSVGMQRTPMRLGLRLRAHVILSHHLRMPLGLLRRLRRRTVHIVRLRVIRR